MNVQEQHYAISKCCNSKSSRLPYTVHDMLMGNEPDYVCNTCNKICKIELIPVWKEVSKGIFRKQ
jgi:hypothetical protein